VFGGRRRRVEKLRAGAAKNLEPGESIRELVQTQTGQSAGANATAVMNSYFVSAQTGMAYRSQVNAAPHLLVVTDRNLYALTLSGARLLNVGSVVVKVPLNQVDLQQEKGRLIFGGVVFNVMGLFGERATRLANYVNESGSSTSS
jgi:hypothetical protein